MGVAHIFYVLVLKSTKVPGFIILYNPYFLKHNINGQNSLNKIFSKNDFHQRKKNHCSQSARKSRVSAIDIEIRDN